MNNSTLEVWARIAALEYLIKHILVMIANTNPAPYETLLGFRDRALQDIAESKVSDDDAETTQLKLQHLTTAVDRLLREAIATAYPPAGSA